MVFLKSILLKNKIVLKSSLAVLFLILVNVCNAKNETTRVLASGIAQNSPIYYIIVASGYYQSHTPWTPEDIVSARYSALRIQELIHTMGGKDKNGIVLIAEPDKIITKNDIKKALSDIGNKVMEDKVSNPLTFFYFIGHGLGDEDGRTLYMLPGDFNLPSSNINSEDIKYINEHALKSVDILLDFQGPKGETIKQMLEKAGNLDLKGLLSISKQLKDQQLSSRKIKQTKKEPKHPTVENRAPYIFLVDACYEGVKPEVIKGYFSSPLIRGSDSKQEKALIGAGIDPKNSFKTYRGALLGQGLFGGFLIESVKPGYAASIADDPRNGTGNSQKNEHLGPLARRMTLIFDEHKSKGESLTIGSLVDKLSDENFDPQTDDQGTSPAHIINSGNTNNPFDKIPKVTKSKLNSWRQFVLYTP